MAGNRSDSYLQLTSRVNDQSKEPSVKELLSRYFYLVPWLIVSVGISLSIAYTRLRYINPVYSAGGKVLIKSDKPGGTVFGEKLGEVVTSSVNNRIMDDQIELIKSTAIAHIVAGNADLHQTYYFKGKLRNRLIHNPASPVRLNIHSIHDSTAGFTMEVRVLNNDRFIINGNQVPIPFGARFENSFGTFTLDKQVSDFGNNKEFICSWIPGLALTRGLAAGIQVGVVTKGGNVLNFVYHAEHPKVAEDIVNSFLNAYQVYSLKDKRESAESALDFIEAQLSQSKVDLGEMEIQLQQFRESNKVVALPEQASGFFGSLQISEDKITEQSVKIKMIDFMIDYLTNVKNNGKSIPLVAGVADGDLSGLIASYNKIQLQKEVSLQSVPAESPYIRELDFSLAKTKNDIIISLSKSRDGFISVLESLKQSESKIKQELGNMPRKERMLLELTRQQKVMEELYATLLQKKLQTSISSASTLSNIQVLESGYSSGIPVSPDPKSFYISAFLIGLIIPAVLAGIIEFLNDKIRTMQDILQGTDTPLLGEIGHVDGKKTLVVTATDRKFTSEQFRIIRTNLQYILSNAKKSNTILVTSCMSGEGKSFIATNIASVVAISGKKTVLIEFDIRKPRLMKGLGMDFSGNNGLTHYLIGKAEVSDIIQPVEGSDNLYIIPCGLIPPNPGELILSVRLKNLFEKLEQDFDMVIVDSPPVGLVSDGYILGGYADATLFVLRHNYTFKKQLSLVQSIYAEKKLPHMSLVINDVKAPIGYSNYAGYANYGYGGYGYGYDKDIDQYFETDKPKRLRWFKRIFGK